jgi:hypothetical protein
MIEAGRPAVPATELPDPCGGPDRLLAPRDLAPAYRPAPAPRRARQRVRPLGARMVCTHCGHRGADVRPDWSQHTKTGGPGGAHRH